MDKRPIVYGYEQGRTFDLLSGIVYAMQGDSRIALDLMGGAGTTVVSGGAATATSPATLSINVAPISIYQLGPTDATTYGALSADSLQILQVGHNDTASTVTFSTSTLTSGQSMWALVEASFVTADSIAPGDPNNGLLLYFNPTNPSSPYQGQNDNGQPQNTLRSNTVQLNVVYGAVATSGSQVPPNPSAGAVPLYLVDLTYGQTQVTTILTAGPSVGTNVPSNYPYAPFLAGLLNSHHSGTTGQAPQINLATETQGNFNRVVQASTPAQFDSSQNLATTAFVQQALGNFSGVVTSVVSSTTLSSSVYGSAVQVSTSGITVTLPPPAGNDGGAIWFYPQLTTGSFTINVTGSGEFISAPTCGYGVTSTSITVNAGEWVCLMNRAGTEWDVVAGSWLNNHQTSQPVVMLTGLQAPNFYGQVTRAAGQSFLASSTSNVGVYEDPSGNGPGDLAVRTGVGTNNSFFIFENNGNFSIPGTYYGSGLGLNLPTSFSGTGYVKLPGNGSFGIILQWGQTSSIPTGNNNSGQTSSPFPIAFPNACLSVQLTTTDGFNNGAATDVPVVNSWNSNSFQWQFWSPNNGNGSYSPWVQFFAIGY